MKNVELRVHLENTAAELENYKQLLQDAQQGAAAH